MAVDGTGRKLEKQIKAAEKLGISCVLFIGDRELKDGLFTLKNIDTGEEEKRSLEAIANLVREHRKQ